MPLRSLTCSFLLETRIYFIAVIKHNVIIERPATRVNVNERGRKKRKTRVVVNFHLDADYRHAHLQCWRSRCNERRRTQRQTINAILHVNQQWKWQWKNGNLKQFQWQKLISNGNQTSLCEWALRKKRMQIICYNKKKQRKNPFCSIVECRACAGNGWCDTQSDSDVISVCRMRLFSTSPCRM